VCKINRFRWDQEGVLLDPVRVLIQQETFVGHLFSELKLSKPIAEKSQPFGPIPSAAEVL
jgi:hypothetical protein